MDTHWIYGCCQYLATGFVENLLKQGTPLWINPPGPPTLFTTTPNHFMIASNPDLQWRNWITSSIRGHAYHQDQWHPLVLANCRSIAKSQVSDLPLKSEQMGWPPANYNLPTDAGATMPMSWDWLYPSSQVPRCRNRTNQKKESTELLTSSACSYP